LRPRTCPGPAANQSAPAPSLDRLQVNYREKDGGIGFTLISPKDKEAFVRDLAQVAPRMRVVV